MFRMQFVALRSVPDICRVSTCFPDSLAVIGRPKEPISDHISHQTEFNTYTVEGMQGDATVCYPIHTIDADKLQPGNFATILERIRSKCPATTCSPANSANLRQTRLRPFNTAARVVVTITADCWESSASALHCLFMKFLRARHANRVLNASHENPQIVLPDSHDDSE